MFLLQITVEITFENISKLLILYLCRRARVPLCCWNAWQRGFGTGTGVEPYAVPVPWVQTRQSANSSAGEKHTYSPFTILQPWWIWGSISEGNICNTFNEYFLTCDRTGYCYSVYCNLWYQYIMALVQGLYSLWNAHNKQCVMPFQKKRVGQIKLPSLPKLAFYLI